MTLLLNNYIFLTHIVTNIADVFKNLMQTHRFKYDKQETWHQLILTLFKTRLTFGNRQIGNNAQDDTLKHC